MTTYRVWETLNYTETDAWEVKSSTPAEAVRKAAKRFDRDDSTVIRCGAEFYVRSPDGSLSHWAASAETHVVYRSAVISHNATEPPEDV